MVVVVRLIGTGRTLHDDRLVGWGLGCSLVASLSLSLGWVAQP